MHRLSIVTFDRFIRSLVVIALLVTAVPITNAQAATAGALPPMAIAPAQRNFVPPLPILQHDAPVTPKQSTPVYLPIRYKTWQAAPLSQSLVTKLPQASVAQITVAQANDAMATTGPMFIENVGQFDPGARFKVSGNGGTLYLADAALWLTILERSAAPLTDTLKPDGTLTSDAQQARKGVNLKFSFVGANPHLHLEPFNRLGTHVSYFIGNDPTQWHADVPVWGGARYVDLYPGIDLEVVNENGKLQQRLVVRDKTQLENVRLRVEGATSIALDDALEHSRLHLTTAIGKYSLPLFPVIGLSPSENLSAPTLAGNDIVMPFAAMQRRAPGLQSLPLQALHLSVAITNTSDLLYSTFLGGGNGDAIYGMTVDAAGNIYVAGATYSTDFPTTTNVFMGTLAGYRDAFVTKISNTGTLSYSTYLGTSVDDFARDISINAQGEAYVTGFTSSSTFPTTDNGFRQTLDGGGVFVTQLNIDGNSLLYSTYLGPGEGHGIAVDTNGVAYVIGLTLTDTFPTTPSRYQDRSCNNLPCTDYDAFISKINPTAILGSDSLVYSTYLHGSRHDCERNGQMSECAIAVDKNGIVYAIGPTYSSDFPHTTAASLRGTSDAFVTKLDTNQWREAGLLYSTYLGGSTNECIMGCSVAVDTQGMIYVTGSTSSNDFPTVKAIQPNFHGSFVGATDAFVTKIDPSNPQSLVLVYSTYLGGQLVVGVGNGNENNRSSGSIVVDEQGTAYVTGNTEAPDFPTTPGAYQSQLAGNNTSDAFVTVIGVDGAMLYSTYLGGTGDSGDDGFAVATGPQGIYVAGQTASTDFPNTSDAFQQTNHLGIGDAFVTILGGSSLLDRMTRNCACPLCCLHSSRNHVGGPIDTSSGNYIYQKSDAAISVLGGTLEFKRSYSADTRDLFTRTLGSGWTHSQDIRLVFPTDAGSVAGQVQLQASGGSQLPFFDLGNGRYQAYPGVTASMSRITATGGITTYVVTATNQTVYTFNSAGLVTQTINPAGNVISYTYYPTGSLQAVQSYGRSLRFYYDAQNRLQRVLDPINRATQFGYNVNGDLAVVTDTRLLTWTYQYSGTTHLLTRILDPDQKTVERTEYDGQGRAVKQYNGQDELAVQLQFGAGGVITVTDGLTRTSVDRYARGTWTGGLDANSKPITRSYDLNFRPTTTADANGNATQMQWSPNGYNLEKITYAPGISVTQKFDGLNNLTRTVDARGFSTVFTYTGSFLTRQTDALTNTWIYTPTSDGRNLLAAELAPGGRLTEYHYDQFGQRDVMTDALTNVTRYGYDPIGRLISTTVNAGQSAYERTTLNRYDGASSLISTTVNFNPNANADPRLYNLTTLYGYDGAGRQIAITDTIGRITRNYYNNAGQLISTTANLTTTPGLDPNLYNLTTRYGYDRVGNRILVTDTRNLVTKTDFDNLNRPVTVTTNYVNGAYDPARPDEDLVHVTHYDPAGNAIEQIEMSVNGALDQVTRTWYDNLNRPITVTRNYSMTGPADSQTNLTTVTTYDAAGNAVKSLDPLSHPAWFRYDELNRLISTTNALSGTTLTQYDAVGNRILVTDVLTRATRYEYDKLNRLITTTFPYTSWVVNTYDPMGNRTRVTDALGHATVYTYNLRGQLIAEMDAMLGTMRYEYDRIGNRVAMTDAKNIITRYQFDIAGHLLVMTQSYTTTAGLDPDTYNLVTRYRYDKAGNVISTTSPLTATTVYTYDALNRLVVQSDGLGRTWNYQYDALGNRAVITDANRLVTRFEFDKANRLTAVFYPTDTVRYGYDGVGNRMVMTDAIGVTTFRYDALNRLTGHTDPFRKIITNTYDTYGNVIGLRYPDGKVVSYTFNANNWLTGVRDWSGRLITYTYDRVGRVITQELPNRVVTAYRYDDANRLTGLTTRNAGWVLGAYTYTLDALGQRTKAEEYLADLSFVDYLPLITYNYSETIGDQSALVGGDGLTFLSPLPLSEDAAATTLASPLPTPVSVSGAAALLNSVPQSSVSGSAFPNGLATTFSSPLPTPPASCLGGLPTFGSTEIINYTYDPLSRLTDAFYSSGACFRYNYDAGGNVTRSEETITATRIITYAYDITSRLQTSKVDVESTTWYYRFDNNGNLKEMTPNGTNPANGAIRYAYTGANQLNKIESHNGSTYSTLAQMAYDGIGSRMVLTGWVSGVAYTTTYASRIAGKVQILQATSGTNSTSYLYGLNQVGEFGSQSVYYLNDGAGSTRHLVDPNGAVKLARLYEPFGQVLMQKGVGDPTYGYLGAQFDRISGLLYINGAYYDPVTGRFLSPVGDGQNPYAPLGGAALAPILILALIGRKKKGQLWTGWLVLAVMMSAGLMLTACDTGAPTPQQPPNIPNPPTPISTPTPTPSATPTPPAASPVPPTPVPCPTPGPTLNSSPSPTPGHPTYTQEELDIAARIVSAEVGFGIYYRGTDVEFRNASIGVAWTMRNRLEIGYEHGDPNLPRTTVSHYTDVFKHNIYNVYPQDIPTQPDPMALEATRTVFDAPNRDGDPTGGSIYVINRQLYLARKSENADLMPAYSVEWIPQYGGDLQGVYFFRNQP